MTPSPSPSPTLTPSPCAVDQIMAVMEKAFDPAFGEAWNRNQVADAVALPNTHALVINPLGTPIETTSLAQPAGFVMSRHAADEEELLLIAIAPEFRRAGLGKALIQRLFDAARGRGTRTVFLEMRRGNPAEYLYRTIGFEPIGKRPNYYRLADGTRADAITFACQL